MFEQFPVSEITPVGTDLSIETGGQYRHHQLTVVTTDAAGEVVTAASGAFAVQFRAHSTSSPEDVLDDTGIPFLIPAATPATIAFDASVCEVIVLPSAVVGATHYRAILKSGN